ncbi:uncharacterized protein EV422DRAFT_102196 [Fimicolochytrium jonesii]|uniref:uncharacterized protein n=1 Tax=Fimicolochytrium jonesii TaxID=1396493 RepID=UPI0022FDF473|nr:uncharacterized protein EV422DRAFT_102196 [Fimicolochytrium jonesii]KAI8819670.1 hypothetical protein EV422DRAFT_102196 [Fimicolochytrium jonesii]
MASPVSTMGGRSTSNRGIISTSNAKAVPTLSTTPNKPSPQRRPSRQPTTGLSSSPGNKVASLGKSADAPMPTSPVRVIRAAPTVLRKVSTDSSEDTGSSGVNLKAGKNGSIRPKIPAALDRVASTTSVTSSGTFGGTSPTSSVFSTPNGFKRPVTTASKTTIPTTATIKVKLPSHMQRSNTKPASPGGSPNATLTNTVTSAVHLPLDIASAAEGTPDRCKHCRSTARSLDPVELGIQANDKAVRKIMDLEIANSSLLAVNTSLENTIRQQAQEMEAMRREAARLKEQATDAQNEGPRIDTPSTPLMASTTFETGANGTSLAALPSTAKSSTPAGHTESEAETALDSVEHTYARIHALMQLMLTDCKNCLLYTPPVHPSAAATVTVVVPTHAIDIETQARQALARKDSQSGIQKPPVVLQTITARQPKLPTKSRSKPSDTDSQSSRTSPVTPTEDAHEFTTGGHRTPGRRTRTASGSDLSVDTSGNALARSGQPDDDPSKNHDTDLPTAADLQQSTLTPTTRRKSILMPPVVDSPTHPYLDDPYFLVAERERERELERERRRVWGDTPPRVKAAPRGLRAGYGSVRAGGAAAPYGFAAARPYAGGGGGATMVSPGSVHIRARPDDVASLLSDF